MEDAMHLKQFLSSKDLPESVAQVYKAGIVLGAPHFTTLSDRQLKTFSMANQSLSKHCSTNESTPSGTNLYQGTVYQ